MVLDDILAAKREAVRARRAQLPLELLQQRAVPADRSLIRALREAPCGFVMECKRAAPSAGHLRTDYDPAALAREYADVADGISVLTDTPFFGGQLEHLRAVSQAVTLPVLCKDFVIDPYQIYEARVHGAHAILLMLAVLSPTEVKDWLQIVRELQMDALVEVHDEAELRDALQLGAQLIGINNRNLKTLEVSLDVTERLAPQVPADVVLISESGIRRRADVRRLRSLANGFLIGTSLMQRPDLAHAARELAYGRVKVCGLTSAQDAVLAWKTGASWGGLIFAEESPRHVTSKRAEQVRAGAPLRWAGVFVNAHNDEIHRAVETLQLDAVQLHGEETRAQVTALRQRLPDSCEIWQACRVQQEVPTFDAAGPVQRLLLDTYDPDRRGGTGDRFDWQGVRRSGQRQRLILAGGLNPDNAAEADDLGVWALDTNSGVEQSPGRKSPALLRRFFSSVRRGRRARLSEDSGGSAK